MAEHGQKQQLAKPKASEWDESVEDSWASSSFKEPKKSFAAAKAMQAQKAKQEKRYESYNDDEWD